MKMNHFIYAFYYLFLCKLLVYYFSLFYFLTHIMSICLLLLISCIYFGILTIQRQFISLDILIYTTLKIDRTILIKKKLNEDKCLRKYQIINFIICISDVNRIFLWYWPSLLLPTYVNINIYRFFLKNRKK